MSETLIKSIVDYTVDYLKDRFVAIDDLNPLLLSIKEANAATEAMAAAAKADPGAFVRKARLLRAEIADLLEAAAAGANLEENAIELHDVAERLLAVETAICNAAARSEEAVSP